MMIEGGTIEHFIALTIACAIFLLGVYIVVRIGAFAWFQAKREYTKHMLSEITPEEERK